MSGRTVVTIDLILHVVADQYGVGVDEIRSDRRGRAIVRPRRVVYWLARAYTPHSLPTIGRALGGRDHTTVLYGLRRLAEDMKAEPALRAEVAAMEVEIERRAGLSLAPEPSTEQLFALAFCLLAACRLAGDGAQGAQEAGPDDGETVISKRAAEPPVRREACAPKPRRAAVPERAGEDRPRAWVPRQWRVLPNIDDVIAADQGAGRGRASG